MKLATVYTDKVDVGSKHMELVEKHSFILSGRLSSRPPGWIEKGVDTHGYR